MSKGSAKKTSRQETSTNNTLCSLFYLSAKYFNPLFYVVFVILYVCIYVI